MAVLQVGEYVPVVEECVCCLHECAVVILACVGVVVFVFAVVVEVFVFQCLVLDVCEISPVAAAELLQVHSSGHVPLLVLVVHVVHQSVGVLCESLQSHGVALDELACVVAFVDAEFLSQRLLHLQVLVVSASVGVVQGGIVSPVFRGLPCGREDVVVLVEIVRRAVPWSAVAVGEWSKLVVAVLILVVVSEQCVAASQAHLVYLLVRLSSFRSGDIVPGLSGLLEVSDIFVSYLEVVAQPCQSAVV